MTAEEFIKKHYNLIDCTADNQCKEKIKHSIIEFAKIHVKSALEAARDDFYNNKNKDWIGEDILKSYPLSNIK